MGKKNIAYINPKMLIWARSETPFISPQAVELIFPALMLLILLNGNRERSILL